MLQRYSRNHFKNDTNKYRLLTGQTDIITNTETEILDSDNNSGTGLNPIQIDPVQHGSQIFKEFEKIFVFFFKACLSIPFF